MTAASHTLGRVRVDKSTRACAVGARSVRPGTLTQ